MYKLLIVDDFFIDRENIKECIDWNELGIDTIIEASNGNEAFDVISRESPDFVLTDVQMPFMSGIELAKSIKKLYPRIKVIFISYYSDFEYLKSAVDLNIYGYILKPVIPEELQQCFRKVIKQVQEEIMNEKQQLKLKELLDESRPLLIERFFKRLFSGDFVDEESVQARYKYLEISIKEGYFRVILVRVEQNRAENTESNVENMHIFNLKFKDELCSICEKHSVDIVIQLDEIHYAIVLNFPGKDDIYMCSDKLFEDLYTIIRNYNDQYISVGVSNVEDSILKTSILYEQCRYALKFTFIYGKRQIINYSDIVETTNMPKIELSSLQEEINIILNSSSKERIDHFIECLFKGVVIKPDNSYIKNICFSIIMCLQLALNEIDESFKNVFGNEENTIWNKLLEFETIIDLKRWFRDILVRVSSYFVNLRNEKNDRIVTEIIEYLKSNYKDDITVRDISKKFYFSPNYLNNIFKGKTGKSIPEYLTSVRIEKARYLLEEKRLKMYEIAEAVGYTRTSYFNNIFKKYTGVTPREYREKL